MLPLQNFNDFILQNNLFSKESNILLAVSGGKDSVLMVHLFKEAGYTFSVAHCNFNLRGDESQRDENFVRMLTSIVEVPFYVKQFDTASYATKVKISIQMAARDLRYKWFEELRIQHEFDLISLAQHQDDAIETVILNLTRGTGIAGLHGILPKRDHLIRPLLFLSRAQIDLVIKENAIDYVEDSSNLTSSYARNKIRHQVLPLLKELNTNLEHTFEKNIYRFRETEIVLQQVVASLTKDLLVEKGTAIHLSIEIIKRLHPQKLLLFELFKPYGFTEKVLDNLILSIDGQSGAVFYSTTHQLIVDRKDVIIVKIPDKQEEEICFIHPHDDHVTFLDQKILIYYSDVAHFENEPTKAFIDAKKLIYPLIFRARQEGDKFIPLGMTTYKKLSDFFVDKKVPLNEKELAPILVNGNGEIIWIGGYRQDDRFKVTGSTTGVAVFELMKG
ncbi:MAG: tRNA lysidine(34) synthetase TilS [Pedobacter sp.]|nr:tRNA lysidine(34) synthetase TilS [Pedobacter sp.]